MFPGDSAAASLGPHFVEQRLKAVRGLSVKLAAEDALRIYPEHVYLTSSTNQVMF